MLAPWERPIGLLQLQTNPDYFAITLSAGKLLHRVALLPQPIPLPKFLKPKIVFSPKYSNLLELNKVANNFDSAP